VGKRIHETSDKIQWREIVGVVENVHDDGVQKPPPPTVYWPFAIANFNGAALHVQRNVAFAVRSPAAGTEAFLKQVRRMALGAPAAAVKRMFLRRGLLLACVGIALGLAATAAFSHLMSSLLFGVTPFDPATYGATAAALLVAALAAT
jgi:hypothetical protein